MSRTWPLPVLILAVGLSACASAGDRLEEGLEFEARGDLYQASLRYIDALDKDATLESARVRLKATGERALDRGTTSAETQGARQPVEAGRAILELDELTRRAVEVGVRLDPPDRYPERRTALLTAASDALVEVARDAERREAWSDAREALREIRLHMAPTEERSRRAGESEARILQLWADADTQAGRYRSAYDLAGEALQLPASRAVELEARSIQTTAVELGTVYVVALPSRLSPAVSAEGSVAPEFTIALDDALELAHWSDEPLFVAVVPPAETRRALRARRAIRTDLDGAELRLLLSDLDADVAAIIEVTEIRAEKTGVDHDVVEIPMEGGGVAATRLETGRLRYTVRADVEVIDSRGRRVRRSSVSGSASDRYELGIYEGDVRVLQLSRRQREHFDPDVIAARRLEIQEQAADALAEDVAARVFNGALDVVPR